MSRPLVTKSLFIPPPIDGLNKIASPAGFLPTEARILDNYLVYDSGIRQIGAPATALSPASGAYVGMLFPYYTDGGSARMLYAAESKIYRISSPSGSKTDVTGTACNIATTSAWNAMFFNKKIYMFDGLNVPKVHDRADGSNCTDFTCTGPTNTTIVQACAYKRRLRLVQLDTTSYWYCTAVDTGSGGTFTQLDLGTVFETPGNLFCIFSWTFNQGIASEELFCAVNVSGEVLVYSGDYEGAANWQLIFRGQLPNFSVGGSSVFRQPFVRTANDVLFVTNRGVIAFSSIFAGSSSAAPLYTVSRKVKDRITYPCTPALDPNRPFIFFSGEDKGIASTQSGDASASSIYVLNYERGAWSRILLQGLSTSRIPVSLAIFSDHLMIGTTGTGIGLHYLNLADTSYATSDMTYRWASGWFDFGDPLQKHSKHIRVLGTNYGAAGSFKNTVSISTQYVDPTSPSTASATTSVTADQNAIQELAPPATGSRLSYYFSRSGTSSVNEKNEIQGFEAYYESGGDR